MRDYAEIANAKTITAKLADEALRLYEIDALGLEPTDRHMLEALIRKFKGGPAGIQSLAAVTGEEIQTIEDVYEPHLIQIGFLERTPRGRVATKAAYQHLGIEWPAEREEGKLL